MIKKILIFALLGCSLVLASAKPEENNGNLHFQVNKPKFSFPHMDWFTQVGNTVQHATNGLVKPFKEAFSSITFIGKSLFGAATGKLHQFSEQAKEKVKELQINALQKSIAHLSKVLDYLKKQLIALENGKIQDIDHQAQGAFNHGVEQFGHLGNKLGHHAQGALNQGLDQITHWGNNAGHHAQGALNHAVEKVGNLGDKFGHQAQDGFHHGVNQVRPDGGFDASINVPGHDIGHNVQGALDSGKETFVKIKDFFGNGVKHIGQKAQDGLKHGTDKVGQYVDHTKDAIGHGIEQGKHFIGHGYQEGKDIVGHGYEQGKDIVGHGFQQVQDVIGHGLEYVPNVQGNIDTDNIGQTKDIYASNKKGNGHNSKQGFNFNYGSEAGRFFDGLANNGVNSIFRG